MRCFPDTKQAVWATREDQTLSLRLWSQSFVHGCHRCALPLFRTMPRALRPAVPSLLLQARGSCCSRAVCLLLLLKRPSATHRAGACVQYPLSRRLR